MKRIIMVALAICLCLLMCACGANEQVENGNGNGEIVNVDTGKEFADVIIGYVNSGDFSSAIQYYNSLNESVKSKSSVAAAYINAVSSYKSDVMRQVDNYVAAGDFTAARSLLTVAGNQIGNDVTISAKMKEVNEKELLKTVQEFETAKNYEAAISYLNQNSSVVSGSMELQVKLETYKEQYRNAVIAQAADVYKNDGASAAISVLSNALKVLHNDSTLNAEKEKYERSVPVSLKEVDVINKGDHFFVDTDSFKREYMYGRLRNNLSKVASDVNGEVYNAEKVHFIGCFRTEVNSSRSDSITYFLNKEFDIFTGVIYRPYVTLYCSFEWSSNGTVEIYGDGALLYASTITQQCIDPVLFRVNVSGVRELKIVVSGLWKDAAWDEDYYSPKLCLTDLMVSKEP